ncbi:hypothetical protein BDZ91DRAFT_730906 [Kalaharituber pfeilii]|nr:hypothetical protein BDZ91DRAFT_730906 [Kalaharituber pfeilii]
MLQLLVSKRSFKFTVFIETPSKPLSKWTFSKECELYGISSILFLIWQYLYSLSFVALKYK